jgi:hypothetical protein
MNKDLELGENFAIANKREEELRKMKTSEKPEAIFTASGERAEGECAVS